MWLWRDQTAVPFKFNFESKHSKSCLHVSSVAYQLCVWGLCIFKNLEYNTYDNTEVICVYVCVCVLKVKSIFT